MTEELKKKLRPEGAPGWIVTVLATVLAIAAMLGALALLFSEIGVTLAHQWHHLKGAIGEDVTHVEVWGIWKAIGAFVALAVAAFGFAAGIPGSAAQKLIIAVAERFAGSKGEGS